MNYDVLVVGAGPTAMAADTGQMESWDFVLCPRIPMVFEDLPLSVFFRNQPSYGTVPKLSLGPDDVRSSLP